MSLDLLAYGAFFLTMALTYAIMCLGLNVQWGQTGLFNVGVAGFVAVGAYVSALLTTPDTVGRVGGFGLPIVVGWAGGALAGGLVSFLVGALTIRLRADYLAIATFGVAVAIQLVVLNLEGMTGGPFGIGFIPRPFAGYASDALVFSLCNLGVVAGVVLILYLAIERLVRSPWGRVLRAIREDEKAALALGKSSKRFRLQAFTIGGAIMALAGAVQGHFIGFIAPENYQPMLTFQVWAMLIVGGSGNNRGAILGAVLVWGLWAGSAGAVAALFPPDQQARAAALQIVMIGVGLCAILLLRPRGIIGELSTVSRHLGGARVQPPPDTSSESRPMPKRPERATLPGGLDISRLVCGLWQVADLEKDGATLDPEKAADALAAYADAGFDTLDMADHYGSAEIIAGRLLARYPDGIRKPVAMTKWCPEPGPMTRDIVRAGVTERLARLGVEQVDLLQFHWWTFEHPAWLDALHEMKALRQEGLIGAIGLTNFDAAHLAVALADGIPVATNQVSFSLVDRRAAGALSELCAAKGVKLFAYGTLCGGFLSEKWLGRPEPASMPDWSRSKYKRFIDAAGGWAAFQGILAAASSIAGKHGVSISNVATRWVLDHTAVAAAIVGARIGESEHRADNLNAFSFMLDADDRALLAAAFDKTIPIPGDCGDEYRRPPYLTASGDLSHHLSAIPSVFTAVADATRPERSRVSSGSIWEPLAGFSRAVRVRDTIRVSGTTATHGSDRCVAPGDAGAQATYILDKIAASITALGGGIEDVVRTRVYLRDVSQWEPVSRAHGRVFGAIRPANTLIQAGNLVGDYEVEIEAEAVV